MTKLGLDIMCGTVMAEHPIRTFPEFNWIGLDRADLQRFYKPGQFIMHDLKDYLPFARDTFSMAWTHHGMEHLPPLHPYCHYSWHLGPEDYLIWVMNEIWRILKPGADIHIVVPWIRHPNAYRDPTHYRFFDGDVFTWFDWRSNQSTHEAYKLWSKWERIRSDVVDETHVYGILRAIAWESEQERKDVVGANSMDWKTIDVPFQGGKPLVDAANFGGVDGNVQFVERPKPSEVP